MTSLIESGSHLPLADQGYQALRRSIVRGEYRPGVRLKIDELQQSLGVSNSPLREALNRLAAEGLVEIDERRGFRAAPVSISELGELTHLRLMLEADALRRSVMLGDDAWEGRLVSAGHRLRCSEKRRDGAAVPDAEDWAERHREFHITLLSACGYPHLLRMCETLFDQAERYRRIARIWGPPRKKNLEHRNLEEAVLSRDADRAARILTAHIRKTADRVLEVLRGSQEMSERNTET